MSYVVDMYLDVDRTCLLQQRRQLRLARLQIRISADMLLLDEDVGHGALARDFLERVLDRGAVVCSCT